MKASSPVFLDANVLVYALDETSEPHAETVALLQEFLSEGISLCTSHHVIEEVLHIVQKVRPDGISSGQVIEEIRNIPDLVLIEPAATLDFAEKYAQLSYHLRMGVNDALLLQLMLDAGVLRLFSYDKKFVNRAKAAGIEPIF